MPGGDPRNDEFGLIAEYFAPLAAEFPEACGLLDDAAWLRAKAGHDLVLTTDALVAGVHFLPDDPPDLVARKLIGVNLSDLAAKGASPVGYLVTLALPAIDRAWLAGFSAGLAADQREYGIALFGGDTVATPGPLTLSATALGWVSGGRMIRRSGACPRDRVFVSGTLGDSALGLAVLRGKCRADEEHSAFLVGRYRRPRPRVALGPRLVGIANAAADISDGLLADLGHICVTSSVGAEIGSDLLPFSPAAHGVRCDEAEMMQAALFGGDDYELVFTAPPEAEPELRAVASETGIPITAIGTIVPGSGQVRVRDRRGREVSVDRAGWTHFRD